MITDKTLSKNRLEPITVKVKKNSAPYSKFLSIFDDNIFKFLCNSQRIF